MSSVRYVVVRPILRLRTSFKPRADQFFTACADCQWVNDRDSAMHYTKRSAAENAALHFRGEVRHV